MYNWVLGSDSFIGKRFIMNVEKIIELQGSRQLHALSLKRSLKNENAK